MDHPSPPPFGFRFVSRYQKTRIGISAGALRLSSISGSSRRRVSRLRQFLGVHPEAVAKRFGKAGIVKIRMCRAFRKLVIPAAWHAPGSVPAITARS